jgi:capsular polysaccharide biosynthesis protein
MSIEDLRRKFIVDEDALKSRLEPVVNKALLHCRIDKAGQVLITNSKLSAKDQVLLVLVARAVAAQLEAGIRPDVTVAEICKYTGLPPNQVRARGKDVIQAKFAESRGAGVYRAVPHRAEVFLDSLAGTVTQTLSQGAKG